MSRMAALVALPVSLSELLEVRARQRLSSRELGAITAQTCQHLATLLEADGHVAAVPLKHVTAQSLQLTGSGQARLGHTELYADVYSVAPGDVQMVLRSLGEVLLSAAGEEVHPSLTDLLTELRDGRLTLQQLTKLLSEQQEAESSSADGPGRPDHEVVALLHEELLGMTDSQPLRSPPRSPSQLELTLNPSLHETAIFMETGRGGPLLPSDSGSVSHAGSFPEVSVGRRGAGPTSPRAVGTAPEVSGSAVEDSKISSSTELRNASCVVSGHFPGRRSPETHRILDRKPATSGATSARSGHRHDLLLEKDMIRLMARESTSAENLATSTPNQSLVAPPGGATVAPPDGGLRRRRPVRRKPSALYGQRTGRPPPGDTVFSGPEFVIRAREKPRRVDLTQRSAVSSCVLVILLNGQKLEIGCHMETHTVADVTKAVFEEEPYPHPSLLGLAVLADGEFLFPPPATRLNKALASPAASRQLTLHQRFKLYPAADSLPKSAVGLHLLYLQLRQNLLENSLDVSSNQVVQLSSLALLAEFGDRSDKACDRSVDGDAAYFLPEHYLPEPLTSQTELLRQLTEGHVTCGAEPAATGGGGGGAPVAAERRFVRVAAGCRGYGRHRCSVDLRVKSYSTSTLSIDPSCLRLSRCDPSGRSTTRTLHWSTVSKIEYRQRSRRLVVGTAGAEALTFCGEKAKLRCLEYMLQQHLTSFREGLQLSSSGQSTTQVYRAKTEPTSPRLTHYCVRTPLSSLTNRSAPRRPSAANHRAASPELANRKTAPPQTTNQKSAPLQPASPSAGSPQPANEEAGSSPEVTNQAAAGRRRRSAGGPLRQRQVFRGAARWRSAAQLPPAGRPARDGSPPATGIRMGTRVPVSALQRQKLRSREALPHLTDAAYIIAAEIPPTPESALPAGIRPIDSSTGEFRWQPATFNVTLHRCPRTGGLGVRVVRAAAAVDGGQLTVEAVTAGQVTSLAAGDVITHISGCPLRPLTYSAAVDRLRRAVDPVTLTVNGRGDGGAATRSDGGAAKRPADEDTEPATDGDDVSRGSLEKRLCRGGVGRESVNDLVIGKLTRQLSGDCLATPAGKR